MPTISDFSRVTILYTDDAGGEHDVPIRTVVAAATGQTATTTSRQGRPARWVLRHVYLVTPKTGTVTHRKRVVCGSADMSLFNGTLNEINNMDGADWRVEGRIGEKRVNAG